MDLDVVPLRANNKGGGDAEAAAEGVKEANTRLSMTKAGLQKAAEAIKDQDED
jgi:hypothetical protein